MRFQRPIEAVKIEGFRTEGDERELIAVLSRTLQVPFIDRTVQPAKQVDWEDVAKPLIERDSEKRQGISAAAAIPPPPPDSRIELSGDVPPTITLPRSGLQVRPFMIIVFASLFAWLGYNTLSGMVVATQTSAEHFWLGWVIGGLFSLIGVSGVSQGISSMFAREYVRDERDELVVGKRLRGIAYARFTVAKDAVTDIAMSPLQSTEGNYARAANAAREAAVNR